MWPNHCVGSLTLSLSASATRVSLIRMVFCAAVADGAATSPRTHAARNRFIQTLTIGPLGRATRCLWEGGETAGRSRMLSMGRKDTAGVGAGRAPRVLTAAPARDRR